MSANINPQEIYLLERYTSLEYFGEMRDTWDAMIKHVERCLDDFMRKLPHDYRKRPLPEQPDAVWGEHVLPNFRGSLQRLNRGFIMTSHGNINGIGFASDVTRDSRGQSDFWSGWMQPDDEETYHRLRLLASTYAFNISKTERGAWQAGSLGSRYHISARGVLNPPLQWPHYRLVPSVQTRSDTKTPVTGIYVPDLENSCAQFLNTYFDGAPEASVLVGMEPVFDSRTGEKYGEEPLFEKRPCTWTLVERVANTNGLSPAPSLLTLPRISVEGGQLCPQAGFYFTPAQDNSRKHFDTGAIMPTVDSPYGRTIWQWDDRQN